jgi:glucose-6-phosphate 1-dehydrogenase
MRGDEVEAAWQWIDPIIEAWQLSGRKPDGYDPGTSGPISAIEMMARDGRRWREIES